MGELSQRRRAQDCRWRQRLPQRKQSVERGRPVQPSGFDRLPAERRACRRAQPRGAARSGYEGAAVYHGRARAELHARRAHPRRHHTVVRSRDAECEHIRLRQRVLPGEADQKRVRHRFLVRRSGMVLRHGVHASGHGLLVQDRDTDIQRRDLQRGDLRRLHEPHILRSGAVQFASCLARESDGRAERERRVPILGPLALRGRGPLSRVRVRFLRQLQLPLPGCQDRRHELDSRGWGDRQGRGLLLRRAGGRQDGIRGQQHEEGGQDLAVPGGWEAPDILSARACERQPR